MNNKIRAKHKWINKINKSRQVGQKLLSIQRHSFAAKYIFCALFPIFKAHFRHEKLDSFQLDMEITAEEVNYFLQGF